MSFASNSFLDFLSLLKTGGARSSRAFAFATAAFMFLVICNNGANAQSKFPKVVLQPELWEKVDLAAPAECEATARKCSLRFLEAAGLVLGKKPSFSEYRLGERDGRNLTIVFVTYKVTDDDSLTGVRYRLAVSLGDVEDRSYKLENLGRQFTCARGHKSWSKTRCP